MRCGFIGYGNMGSAVVRALLGSGSLREHEAIVYNRTPGRMDDLRRQHPGAVIASSMSRAAMDSDVLFICVHTPAVPEVLAEVHEFLLPAAHLVTINGGIGISHFESVHDGAVSKVIPSITIGTGRGVTLISHGRKVTTTAAGRLEALFAPTGRVMVLPEDRLGPATDITSCGPGLMASMIAQFALSGARAGGLDPQQAVAMAMETMMGTALMLADGLTTPVELAGRVATRGGITEQGLKVLEGELPGTFDRMFGATQLKRAEVASTMAEQEMSPHRS